MTDIGDDYAGTEEDYYRDQDDSYGGGGGWFDWLPSFDSSGGTDDPSQLYSNADEGGSGGVGFVDSLLNFAQGVDNTAFQRDVLEAKRDRYLLDITTPKELDVEPEAVGIVDNTSTALLVGGAAVAGLIVFNVFKRFS